MNGCYRVNINLLNSISFRSLEQIAKERTFLSRRGTRVAKGDRL